jgi:hypothetical protein
MHGMAASILARMVVTAVAGGQGIVPLSIDLNKTHATNPLWPGHARFHVVWQTFSLTIASAIEVGLIWWPSPQSRSLFYLASLLTSVPMCGFLFALFTRRAYQGTLHDPNGIQPMRIRIAGKLREIDMNAVLVILGAAVLICAVAIF